MLITPIGDSVSFSLFPYFFRANLNSSSYISKCYFSIQLFSLTFFVVFRTELDSSINENLYCKYLMYYSKHR